MANFLGTKAPPSDHGSKTLSCNAPYIGIQFTLIEQFTI